MSIASIIPFLTALAVVVGVATALVLGLVAVTAYQFFAENRPVRVARQEPVLRYYRQHAFSH